MFVEVEVMQKPDYSQFKCGVAAKCRCIVLKVETTSANELTILFTKFFAATCMELSLKGT